MRRQAQQCVPQRVVGQARDLDSARDSSCAARIVGSTSGARVGGSTSERITVSTTRPARSWLTSFRASSGCEPDRTGRAASGGGPPDSASRAWANSTRRSSTSFAGKRRGIQSGTAPRPPPAPKRRDPFAVRLELSSSAIAAPRSYPPAGLISGARAGAIGTTAVRAGLARAAKGSTLGRPDLVAPSSDKAGATADLGVSGSLKGRIGEPEGLRAARARAVPRMQPVHPFLRESPRARRGAVFAFPPGANCRRVPLLAALPS